MKNNTRKILLALLLVFTVLVSMATVTAFAEDSSESTDGTVTVYFQNNWLWSDVSCHYWGATSAPDTEWPGVKMTLVGYDGAYEVYSASVPADATGLIINGLKDDGSGNLDQTPDITSGIVDGAGWKMVWVEQNGIETYTFNPDSITDAPSTPSGPSADGNVFTVAGVGTLCYSEWDVADSYNDMTLNSETGLYEKTFTGIPAGSYECKVAANHSWDQSWGTAGNGEFGNYSFTTYDEHDITITFDPATGTVGHVTAESTGEDTNRPVPEKPDIDATQVNKIYLSNTANWDTAFVYFWTQGSSDQNAAWPGQEMEWDSEKMLYYVDVPTYYVNIIFNNGNGVQTADLAIPGDGYIFDNSTNAWDSIGNFVPPTPPENTSEDVTIYVKDDAGWGDVWIYYWDADGMEAFTFPGTPMEKGDDGYYYATIPAGYYSVLFSNGGSWEDGSLLQTPDLRIPTDNKVYLSNGHEALYNEGVADDNNAWFAGNGQGGNDSDNKPGTDVTPDDNKPGEDGGNDQPAPEMTLIQKIAKAILLFLRRMEEMFMGFFKK